MSFDFTDLRRTLRESAYTLTAFPLGLASFVLMVTLVSRRRRDRRHRRRLPARRPGRLVARGFARLERFRLRTWLERDVATPAYVCARPDAGFLRRTLTPLRDPQSWLDVVWCLVSFVTGTFVFVVTLAWWAAAANGLTYWFWERFLPRGDDDSRSPS